MRARNTPRALKSALQLVFANQLNNRFEYFRAISLLVTVTWRLMDVMNPLELRLSSCSPSYFQNTKRSLSTSMTSPASQTYNPPALPHLHSPSRIRLHPSNHPIQNHQNNQPPTSLRCLKSASQQDILSELAAALGKQSRSETAVARLLSGSCLIREHLARVVIKEKWRIEIIEEVKVVEAGLDTATL